MLELIRHRLTESRRSDPFHLALGIEGGAGRAAFTGGMARALADLGILRCVDSVYGTSAGAWIALWLLSGHAHVGLSTDWWSAAKLGDVVNVRSALRGRRVVDTEKALDVTQLLLPSIFDAVLAQPIPLRPLATAIHTGSAADLSPHIHDERTLRLALRATAAIPLLTGPPIELAGRSWLDGGLSEHIPYRTPIEQGATHLLLLRASPADRTARRNHWLTRGIVSVYLRRHAPAMLPIWRERDRTLSTRRQGENDTVSRMARARVFQLRPPIGAPPLAFVGRDLRALRTAFDLGRSVVRTDLAAATQKPPEPTAQRTVRSRPT